MKLANCPFGAAGLRARMPPPPVPTIPPAVQRVMKRLAIAAGFACGCWLGSTWAPASDAWQAIAPPVMKSAPLVVGLLVLRRGRHRGN